MYTTTDEFNELQSLVRTILGEVTTLNDTVGALRVDIDSVDHIVDLKDVTIMYITEGDLLLYSLDGTWHNVSPAVLADYISGEGGIIDTAVVKSLIALEGSKLFLSKLYDDTAAGIITFQHGLISNGMIYTKEGITIGDYQSGLLGSGAIIDKNGNIEATSLTLREFLSVPELRFNRVDVVSGELWNAICFGTFESVDTKNQIGTLKLEEGEYSGIHINDICRGIWHNISGVNETTPGVDSCGFDKMQGFSTSYFTPVEILDDYGKRFRYSLKPGTTLHPTANMKFAVYGNFIDESRQYSAYHTRGYLRFLKKVNTWEIKWLNFASHFGNLEGITIPGAPGNGHLQGYGAYMDNVYITGAFIQFKPEQEAQFKGEDAYSVNLTKTDLSVIVDNDLNILDKYSQLDNLTFGVQAFRGKTELTYSEAMGEGKFIMQFTATDLTCTMANGIFTITNITSTVDPHIDIVINCEGAVTINKRVDISYKLQPNALWQTYNDNDSIPDRPTGDGTTNGWHRNYTASAVWMSTKSSIEVDDPTVQWGDPNRFRGASVAGKDGEYTVFAYTESSVAPATPTGSILPPNDPNGIYTWSLDPPQGDVEKGIWVWQSTATVKSDKSMTGWTVPFRLSGADGKDGEDGKDIEFLYYRTRTSTAPALPPNSQKDDISGSEANGWTDNPQGVTVDLLYEWAAQRVKPAAKAGTGRWQDWTGPTVWSKWGEKGMDGDGYEYIYYRTTDLSVVVGTPVASNNEDESHPIAYIDGKPAPDDAPGGKYWTDDPQGVREDLMIEWVSTRKKTNGTWSNFQRPAIWSKWGETGLSGGNWQLRYRISATKPTLPVNNPDPVLNPVGWSDDSELIPPKGSYVWQMQRFKNPDGSYAVFPHPDGGETIWTALIRTTGADGKDGEDGNSIEFLYARNNDTANPPQTPVATDPDDDWHGAGPDGTMWYDNPQGVDDQHRYEYVTLRYKDKSTQQWGAYSTPGIWAVFADKGKDGDGYEYIYATFSNYDSATKCDKGEQYYPASPSYGSSYINGDYQQDDHVPTRTWKGVTFTYTDNAISVTEAVPYQVCWTRKKENGRWGDWKNGFIWTKWGRDGEKGDKGDKGDTGNDGADGANGTNGSDGVDATTYNVTPNATTVRLTRTNSYDPGSITFTASRKTGSSAVERCSGYWQVLGSNNTTPTSLSNGTIVAYDIGVNFTFNINSHTKYSYYTVGFNTSGFPFDDNRPAAASATITVVLDGLDGSAADAQYTDIRFRGVYSSNEEYYYNTASKLIDDGKLGFDGYENPDNAYVRDQVIYHGGIYMVASVINGGVNTPPTNSYGLLNSDWVEVSQVDAMAINTLLADNAVLGAFKFSNNLFWSGEAGTDSDNAKLYMNSDTGEFRATDANITGTITATSGTFTGEVNATSGIFKNLYFENCFTKNRVLNIDYRNTDSFTNAKYGDSYSDGNYLYTYQSDGWERAEGSVIHHNSNRNIVYLIDPSYSKIINCINSSDPLYPNMILLPAVNLTNYGTTVYISVPSFIATRSITGMEGTTLVGNYDTNSDEIFYDDRCLKIGDLNCGGQCVLTSTPYGWLINNCQHKGCDNNRIIRMRIDPRGNTYDVNYIYSIFNYDASTVTFRKFSTGYLSIFIPVYYIVSSGSSLSVSARAYGIGLINANAEGAAFNISLMGLSVEVKLFSGTVATDGSFFLDIYNSGPQYVGQGLPEF